MISLIPTEHWDYSFADAVWGLRTAFSPGQKTVSSRIRIPELGDCVPIRSARAAIVVALKALSLRDGASIAVPLYCCPVVLSAIRLAGYRARFIDVDPSTYCISASDLATKSSEVDAVIAVHMFGNMCDMPALRRALPGKPIVEDCAQALGSRIGGQVAGSFGEIAVFSFRSGKYISSGEGGAVFCAQADLESRVSKLINELPVPGRASDCVHVLKTYLRSLLRRKPLWGLLGNRLWSAYSENVAFTSQAPIVMERIYATDYSVAVRRLSKLDSLIERQRLNAAYYSRNLTVHSDMICSETQGVFFNRLQFPILLPTLEQCDELAACLQKEQISSARPYKDIASIASKHYGYTGDCPRAEFIAKRVLVIPCNYKLGAAELNRIATSVSRAWAQINGCRGGVQPNVVRNAISPKNREGAPEPNHFL